MAPRDDHIELLKALAVSAELTGTELSEAAARVMAEDLSAYPIAAVLAALSRCRREIKGRMTVAAIIERIDDGHPGPDEAWALIPTSEAGTSVWTQEMAEAWGVAYPLLKDGDRIAGRMAFRETYVRLVQQARAERTSAKWTVTLGHDPYGRMAALDEAVRKGRITQAHVDALLPHLDQPANVLALPSRTPMPDHVRLQLRKVIGRLTYSGETSR